MQTSCANCQAIFEITPFHLELLDRESPIINGKKFQLPPPDKCPDCRQQQRLAFRNERKLYSRKCDLSGKPIISIYSPDKPFKVYDQPEWWSDKWQASDYAMDYNFNRPFFDQLKELYLKVPRVSMHTINVENSVYSCYTLFCKNCYLLFGGGHNEDCMYGKYVSGCKNTFDSLCVYSLNWCYETIDCDDCYNCRYLTNCRNCSDSTMIEDCIGCRDCIGCFGLNNAQYHIFNVPYSKEEYQKYAEQVKQLSTSKVDFLRNQLQELKKDMPQKTSHIYASEECEGDAIFNSKNCVQCYDVKDSEDCAFLWNGPKCVSTMDSVYCSPDGLQFCYNVCSCVGSSLITCYFVWYCDNVYYSLDCLNSKNLLACVGLRNKQYCILNKQYTKEEYELLASKIIEELQSVGAWGQFFPFDLAPCAYNETVAQEYYPLSKDQALALGSQWKDDLPPQPQSDHIIPANRLPETISNIPDDILNWAITCESTNRPFKILPAELAFYRRLGIPIPKHHPDERHSNRLARQTSRTIAA